jgi:hypothetical protein
MLMLSFWRDLRGLWLSTLLVLCTGVHLAQAADSTTTEDETLEKIATTAGDIT